MKSVLITGGAGFIGSSLAIKLNESGYKAIVLDSLSPQIHGAHPETTSATFPKILNISEFHKGDVRDRELVSKLASKSDIVVHLAAETGTGQSMYAISEYASVNIQGTAVLLEEIMKSSKKPEKIVVASSRAIYGEGKYECSQHGVKYPDQRSDESMSKGMFDPLCDVCGKSLKVVTTTEDSPAKPLSIYGITKLNQEQMVLTAAGAAKIPAVALRFQNVYGPGQSLSNPYTGILSIFSTRARENKSINIFEDGEESRDFVFIDDVVESLYLAITSQHSGAVALNIGSGIPTTVNTVVEHIMKFFSSKSEVAITGQYRVGDIRHNVADLEKAKRVLGFKATVPFAEGIARFLGWATEQQNIKDDYDKSLSELRERGLLK
ncbi:NAD-dependent epimerase/dehydratase family protein [Bdellovibrio sp. HCB209]|uniref:NAD-dependent epimerase/dehydratase family protein n=1 Tax=Bdellovibrio sp. HCB209 TaxID=3394354 RepID=UPI0039B46E9D